MIESPSTTGAGGAEGALVELLLVELLLVELLLVDDAAVVPGEPAVVAGTVALGPLVGWAAPVVVTEGTVPLAVLAPPDVPSQTPMAAPASTTTTTANPRIGGRRRAGRR
ncbi:MAG: hypothetical protein KGQ66_16930 [Acidobacteriota bacterium]|nr:hypothetical protein [Acidobacteriota bacterium]